MVEAFMMLAHPRSVRRLVALALLVAPWKPAAAGGPDALDYNRAVRPILSNNCFKCHGPDEAERKAGLRLDLRESALVSEYGGKKVVVPGKPAESALLDRIEAPADGKPMPPPSSGKKLTPAEKEVLRRWIAEGAEYREHWAFTPPRRPPLPEVRDASWARNPVDRFILARLEAEGLAPSPEASPTALIRRLSLDLTGLPPTPAEIDAFLADSGPDAYGRAVERLLASPRSGERLALEWLDAARFADTNGYHIDNGRDMTHWRDWVIDSFNRNIPFDRFTIEQIAGDLLPEATREQRIASGFNRNHMINFEGGAIPEEYHAAYIVDRVNTTATVWLGLTAACTQCHDHKYDPMTQREFYGLYAFFHNIPENGLDGNTGNAAPLIKVPGREEEAMLERLQGEVKALKEKLSAPWPEVDAAQAEWETAASELEDVSWTALDVLSMRSEGGASFARLDDGSVLVSGANADADAYFIEARSDLASITGIRVEALPDDGLAEKGPGRSSNGNIVLTEARLAASPEKDTAPPRPVKLRSASADFSQKDFPAAAAIDGKPETGWAILPETGKPHALVLETAEPLGAGPGVLLRVTLEFRSPFARHQIGRFRLAATSAAHPRGKASLPEDVRKALAVDPARRGDAERARLRKHFRAEVSPAGREVAGRLARLEKERNELDARIPTAMVMQEMEWPRDTFVLVRGQYDKKGEKVVPGVPAFLHPLPDGAPPNRLGLARWLVDPRNPLTARVIVNRWWQMLFGTGMVKTAEDFGSQGELPSHPELLDWLAVEFVESGWDVKRLIRLLVGSAAYRQSAAVDARLLERDPENRLLARGPRFRLQAEIIRDQALAVSGLLDDRIGGPSVSPYQPPGLWEELAYREDGRNWTAQAYVQSHGRDLYRRGMYTFWKRTSPPPTLVTFDAPDRETCTVRRPRTNTPLQALILLNDPTYVEAARKLAERMMREGGSAPGDRIRYAFRLCTSRLPDDSELDVLLGAFEGQRAVFGKDPSKALQLLAVGESPRDESLDPAELAALSVVASMILNLDETLTR
jgi:hypothetical protein